MQKRNVFAIAVCFIVVFSLISQVSAITATLGSSRMVLKMEAGDVLKKYVTVVNKNEVPVKIELTADGDLGENIELEETEFELSPGQEKKAYFEITAPGENGMTETKINVKFIPTEGNPVGLSATVIVIVSDGEEASVDEEVTSEDEESDGVSFNPTNNDVEEFEDKKISGKTWLLISTGVLVLIFAILAVYAFKVKGKKGSRRPRE